MGWWEPSLQCPAWQGSAQRDVRAALGTAGARWALMLCCKLGTHLLPATAWKGFGVEQQHIVACNVRTRDVSSLPGET